MGMFQLVDLSCQGFRRIARQHRNPCLENRLPVIVELIHFMDGDAAFGLSVKDNRFVYTCAIHALPPIFREQGRVYINDMAGVGFYQGRGDFPKETCQHDTVDSRRPQFIHISVSPEKGFFFEHQYRDTGRFCDIQHTGTRLVAANQGYPYVRVSMEVTDDFTGVGACARGKYGDLSHTSGMAAKLYLFAMRAWLIPIIFFLSLDAGGQSLECLGKQHPYPVLSPQSKAKLESQLADARKAWENDSSQADVIVWYGRRLAYLGHYHEAIEVYSHGLTLYPTDARFLRHRGHRWITLRCNREAIIDLTRAAELVRGKPDEVEPDGMPNAMNIPTSTLQTNIWYHLGLALYLEKDFNRASEAWKTCLKLSANPDMYMATAYWLYISLRRAGREEEARALLTTVEKGVELIENEDYYTLLLLYKGSLPESDVLTRLKPEAGTLSNATTGYALGVYYLLKGNREMAGTLWEQVLAGNQWSSFGFIAAESEK